MATSSKVSFKLDALREKALESLDIRIALAQTEFEAFMDDEALEQRRAEWFTEQRRRVLDLAARLEDDSIEAHELSRFKIGEFPDVDSWDRRRSERQLRDLRELRSQVEAKASALSADEHGNVSLTRTQLREFFAL